MASESIREKLARIGTLPGLSQWRERLVLLLRCGDIDQTEFKRRVRTLQDRLENLYQDSLPEAMDEETYLACREYYEAATRGLECYLSGLETLTDWADIGELSLLKASKLEFAKGDRISQEVVALGFEAQESFKELEEELMRSHGLDPEGIG